ncbi:MAG: hypothetical protein ACJA1A_001426 [Saprospiraceae bacterium]|jgi:hypothetical protein
MSTVSKKELKKVRDYCKVIIEDEISQELICHGWNATKSNIKIYQELSKKIKLTEKEDFVIQVAIYFLYTGFGEEDAKPYQGSKSIAEDYLRSEDFPHDIVASVRKCIDLKLDGGTPSDITETVFLDTVYSYYGAKKLKKRISTTWEERNFLRKVKVDLLTALEKKNKEIEEHSYNTSVAKKCYDYRKPKNLVKLKSVINKEKNKNNLSSNKTAMTMFKTASRNHIDLINIADKKAGIMISINAILMTVMIPILGSYIIDVSRFVKPSSILILTCGAAVILATMATRPQLSDEEIDKDDKFQGEKSLFYFGNFFEMRKEDYRQAVKDVIVRDITLENSIINDLYDMGAILGIKYKRLRWC